ncbi:MAG: SIMPL domain-containing protein [Quisquiliibacterium sp.]
MLLGCTTFLLGVAPPAKAADAPAAAGPTLRLQESASREVAKDTATAVFVIEREGSQPGALQSEVNGVIAAALADLKSDKALIVSSGRYSTYPRHSRDGRIQSWRVRAELLAESTDIDAVSRATATLSGRMNLGSIGFSLSLAAREKVEAELIAEAANRFYQTAREAARALGFSEVELIEASYNKNQSGPPMPMARAVMSAAAETPSVPMQPGQATVTVSFGGALRLKR